MGSFACEVPGSHCPQLSLCPFCSHPAAFLPSPVSGEATLPSMRGGDQNPGFLFSGLLAAFSKMALDYFCNISILQREGPREALGQVRELTIYSFSHVPLIFLLPLFTYLLFKLHFSSKWPHREISIPPPFDCSPCCLLGNPHSCLSHNPLPFRPAPCLWRTSSWRDPGALSVPQP